MRRKSLNPKKLSKDETEAEDRELCDTELAGCTNGDSAEKSQSHIKRKPELNNNNLNGSDDTAKVVAWRGRSPNSGNVEIFTFEAVPTARNPRKCSCHVLRKNQGTQTPRNAKEWFDNVSVPVAVNPTPVQSGLPSPSWSQSSDSEGSLPRTPNKAKLYNCEVCGKAFPTPSKLRRHFLIHSGEKPFSCRICGKPFNDPANLKRHHWSHIKEKPFICHECQGKFMTKRDAMMHLCPATRRKRKYEVMKV